MPALTTAQKLRRAAPSAMIRAERLVEQNRPLVHWAVGTVLKLFPRPDPNLYDEAVAEGLLILWRSARGFEPGRGWTFGTYAMNALANGLLRWRELRERDRGGAGTGRPYHYPLMPDQDGRGEPLARDTSPDRVDPVRAKAAFEALVERGRMNAAQRHVIRRRYGEGATLGAIAVELSVSKERVRQIKTAALERIKKVLRRAGEV